MEIRDLTCIGCPMGCQIRVTLEGGQVKTTEGYTCRRGDVYARKEVTNPTRIVTSSVRVSGGELPVVSVKTASDIPREKIGECVKALKELQTEAPVAIGDVLLRDVAHTGVDIVATRNVRRAG